jgi:hypothetical protein
MTQQIGIYDHETGEQSTREMTSAELADYEAALTELLAAKAVKAAELQSAKEALLSSLGITEQQAIVLGLIQAPVVPRLISKDEA